MKLPLFSLVAFFSSATLSLACSSSSDTGSGDATNAPAGGAPAGGARFFLPTGEPDNTSAPVVEVDPAGNTHAVYPAYAGGGAYYAYCGVGCHSQDDTEVVRFDTDGTTTNAMIALDADGHPRVLLAAYDTVYFGSCDSACGDRASWSYGPIFEHDAERDITGEAFTLDGEGRPRFLLHTRVAYLGIGQRDPETRLFSCDADCTAAGSWSSSVIAEEIWQSSHLRYDASGKLKVATVVTAKEGGLEQDTAAYLDCDGDCALPESWNGIGLGPVYQSEIEAVSIDPTVSMALDASGAPRVAFLGQDEAGEKHVLYFECDEDCRNDNWRAISLSSGEQVDAGVDVALDADGHPRVVYTHNYNIALMSCELDDCTLPDTDWHTAKVEAGGDMPPDQIMPYPNCTVGLWFLHSPTLALTASGEPRVGYQARDISGGTTNPDPNSPDCVAGTDMTWSRLALLPSVQ